MSRPRLLYVPILAAREAGDLTAAAEWAEVATFDAPGVGANRDAEPRGFAGVADAALAQIDELGWPTCAVVCDSHGQAAAVELAVTHPERVEAIAIGHAAARYSLEGSRPAISLAMLDAARQLLDTDYRSFARAITQMTQGLLDDAEVDAWAADVPQPVARDLIFGLAEQQPDLVARLRASDLPVVLARHRGCVVWTPEGFEDACLAVPHATTVTCDGLPRDEPAFFSALKEALA